MRGELTLGTDTVPRSRAAARAKARSGGSQSQAGMELGREGAHGPARWPEHGQSGREDGVS
jgi:hypothetical protein